MARAPRAFPAGIYHLDSHGSDERYLFLTDGERKAFATPIAAVVVTGG